MDPAPRLTSLVRSLPATVPFVGPETQERQRGQTFVARLGANELTLGPSPAAVEAMARSCAEAWKYGDPENHDLREALAVHHGVPADCIVVGEGIDGLLGYLVRMLVEPGTPVVTSKGAYPTFAFHVVGHGGELHTVPYVNDCEDPASLLDKAREVDAHLIYLANPDNPMGTWHGAEAVTRMIDARPKGALLVLDEAYIEFAPDGTAPPIDVQDPGVIRMRTFSKAYGLAGARIGYAIAHKDLIAAFHKVRNHFGVNRVAQMGALAALSDQVHLQNVIRAVDSCKQRLADLARRRGWNPLPSATNFQTIDLGRDGAFARSVVTQLAERRIFTRMPFVAPQDRCIRISCGNDAEIDALEQALKVCL
ncbi:MAG: pyridoxal phosphate-dependent aminotransferase [Planctomycetota bacterium]